MNKFKQFAKAILAPTIRIPLIEWQISNCERDIKELTEMLERDEGWLHSSDVMRARQEIRDLRKHVEFLEWEMK